MSENGLTIINSDLSESDLFKLQKFVAQTFRLSFWSSDGQGGAMPRFKSISPMSYFFPTKKKKKKKNKNQF